MSKSKPMYVFVGGVSHTAAFFEDVIYELARLEYKAYAVSMPTLGDSTEGTKQWDEVRAIYHTILHLINTEKQDVVLVMHSYGGWPGSRAIKGLDRESRAIFGRRHGIVEVVFIAAFLLPDNALVADYSYLPPWLTIQNDCRIPNEAAISLLFSDMDPASRKYWLSKFEWHRNDFAAEMVPDAPWHLSVPKTYIFTTEDKVASLDFQLRMVQGVLDSTWSFKSIKSGHEPFLSQPANLVKVLLQPSF